jgi:probable addiction module antidote protein
MEVKKMYKVGDRKYMDHDDFIQRSFKKRPEQVDLYLNETIKDYNQDKDFNMLIVSLRDVVRAKGVCYIAKKAGLTRQAIYKALSLKGNPTINTLNTILDALGYKCEFNLQKKLA